MTTAADINLNDVTTGLQGETVVSLDDVAEEPGGAWPTGWYAASFIEGYATAKGHQFLTEDTISQKGDSRNLRLCVAVSKGEETRNIQEQINYRPLDLTAERITYVKEARVENKGIKQWPDRDAQRSSLALASLGQITKALGFGFKVVDGNIAPANLVGQKVDVRLGIDEKGYNTITAFAAAGSKVKR